MSKTLTIRLTDEQASMIDDLKASQGIKTASKVIIDCLEKVYAENQEVNVMDAIEKKYSEFVTDILEIITDE